MSSERIALLEKEILDKKKELAALRRAQSPIAIPDFEFSSANGSVKLSQLFGNNRDLLIIHNMGKSCSYCTLWADGFNGVVPELESRTALVFVSADPFDVLDAFAKERNWRFDYYGSLNSEFRSFVGLAGKDGAPWPGAVGLRLQDDGAMTMIAVAEFGEGDDFCPTWHLLDLLADGWNGWHPSYRL